MITRLNHKKECRKRTAGIIIGLLVIGGIIGYYRQTLPYHFQVVKPGLLYRSGWMKPRNMNNVLQKYHIRTVVNLCLPTESTYLENYRDEQCICQKNDVTIVNIPLQGNTPPSEEQTALWLSLLKDKAAAPILVHCAQGATRTAAMVAIYKMEFAGENGPQVVRRLETFGHQLSDPKRQKIYEFIVNYQPHINLFGQQVRIQ